MSRHLLVARPDCQVVLGFDHMLRSFFGQVFKPNDRDYDGITIAGWPTASGLGARRPAATRAEATEDLALLLDWAKRQQPAEVWHHGEATRHLVHLCDALMAEWADGRDQPTRTPPMILRGAAASRTEQLFGPRLHAVARALLPLAQRTEPLVPAATDLDDLDEAVLDQLSTAGRAVLAALDGLPPKPRAAGPLNAADAEALRLDLNAGTILILSRDRSGRAACAYSAVTAGAQALPHDEGAQDLWLALARHFPNFVDQIGGLTKASRPGPQEPSA